MATCQQLHLKCWSDQASKGQAKVFKGSNHISLFSSHLCLATDTDYQSEQYHDTQVGLAKQDHTSVKIC